MNDQISEEYLRDRIAHFKKLGCTGSNLRVTEEALRLHLTLKSIKSAMESLCDARFA